MATSEPRPAATVVILRDGFSGPELLLTIRPKHLRFMGGAAVFPGGAVAEADADPRWAAAVDGPADAARICALREAFEEVGYLAASGPADRITKADADDANVFLAACLSLGVRPNTAALVPGGRWVTPLGSTVRFDTAFFLTRATEGWEPIADPNEVESWEWVTAANALERLSTGDLLMAPPTIEMLQRIAGHASIEEVFDALREDPVDSAGRVLSFRLSPLVHVILAPNPGPMTGPGTNTYVVGSGPTVIIDPAVTDDGYLVELRRVAKDVSQILITHRHPDHVGGARTLAESWDVPVRAFGDADAGGATVTPLEEGELIDVGGARLETLHLPGHAPDHLGFLMQEAASLFAGDVILGEGTAVIAPPEGNMRTYLATLQRLLDFHIDRIYPGHFKPLDGGRAVIEGYIAHRAERREQVLSALAQGASTPEEIVRTVYVDTPAALHPVAVQQVLAMLEMLVEDDVVDFDGSRWRTAPVS